MSKEASVTDLRLKFPGSSSLLFKDVSSSFIKGEKVLILGPSGCGKSTLLQVLSGLIPHSIEVPIKVEKQTIPNSWGYVFQDPDTQFCMPFVDEEIAFVLENLQIPRQEMNEKIKHYINMVSLDIENLHTSIQTLSGGMKQRLAIASVMALEPEVLFLDEPTAMLDPKGTRQVWETIKSVTEDKTVIVVEHNLNHVLDFIDRIILMNANGEIMADGPKQEILSNYKEEIIDQGIWYPGVWDDYIESRESLSYDQSEEPQISLKNFKGFRGKKVKIDIEEAAVTKGEWITVIGENGAGKSTLLHALMKLVKTSGDYSIEGQTVENIKKLTDQVTFVFQNPEFQFVTNSVFDEVAFTLRLEKHDEIFVEEKTNKLLHEFKIDEQKNQHPYQLSMGQKRRLSVAAAIIKEQKIVLLDEPTFGQDAKNTFAILEMIEHWQRRGTTIIMVTHSMEIVKHFSTRVWEISKGTLVFDGDPKDYFRKEKEK
ncbi:ATP-binding cassette domain-containing protein [Bacillus carboniphilus]|uniref:ATP-binding cassette domain-containing protein n=1 Tax=Bacillus carboniphilus TaxID=86663 RepID=A0ABY9JXA8_9BACI|nr:ATP-binding cassette domain-containing protein [Bacillus carboniphilus]WLR43065.1 ATP-binding cassette domain-containing protein [Bacillus carboniphilus]